MRRHCASIGVLCMALALLGGLAVALAPAAQAQRSDPEVEIQVVGGNQADVGEYPFMTVLFHNRAGGPVFQCGATLIDPSWVMTAAHCLDTITSPDGITLLVGASDRRGSDGEFRAAKRIIIHPDYVEGPYHHDVALIELSRPASAPTVQLATSTNVGLWANESTGVVTGWGDTESSLGYPTRLHEVDVPVLTDAQCAATRIGPRVTFDIMLCAGEEGRDACLGDSGGPLLIRNGDSYLQLGITSFGIGCAREGLPGVYTELPVFADWVAESIADSVGQQVEVSHTVSCLAGNGRVDTNVVNTSSEQATYRLEFDGLSPRAWTVDPGDWWRSPITGRADGGHEIVVLRNGERISRMFVLVDCDDSTPQVERSEISVINACRFGNGYILFQFANPNAQARAYLIEFEQVPNRSTSADSYGASVRAVTGRGDGTWEATISADGETIASLSITVDCDP